jgi:hypothetical protein
MSSSLAWFIRYIYVFVTGMVYKIYLCLHHWHGLLDIFILEIYSSKSKEAKQDK